MSEFGKGFVYNLLLFMHHFDNERAHRLVNIAFVFKQTPKKQAEILVDNPGDSNNYGFNKDVKWWLDEIVPIYGSKEKALSNELALWANGASDHLYEIEVPEKWKDHLVGQKTQWLKDFALEMGHRFLKDKIYTWEDYIKMLETLKEIGLLIDKELGIKVEKGEWE